MLHTLFIEKNYLVFHNQKKVYFQMFVINLNGQNLITLLLQILAIIIIFLKKILWHIFFSSTCGQNMSLYGLSDFRCQLAC